MGGKARNLGLAQQALDTLAVSAGDIHGALEAAGALGRLVLQQVAAVCLLAAQLALAGRLEALGSALVSLLLHEY